jgi:uncharacterized membrane protein YqjE
MLERLYSLLGLKTWMARLRRALSHSTEAIEDRWLLARIEMQETKRNVLKLVLYTIAALALTIIALLMLSFALVVTFWNSPYRMIAIWGLSAMWLVCWAAVIWALLRSAQASGQAFLATRQELARDWQALKEKL